MLTRKTTAESTVALCSLTLAVWVSALPAGDAPQRPTATATTEADAQRPNIVFFLVDDLGWMDLRCQGNDRLDTPNIDRLASQGMRFTDAYAAAPVCSPTRAAILTGQAPARLRLTTHIPDRAAFRPKEATLLSAETLDHLPSEHVTIAERLKAIGYATAFLGKWHLAGAGGSGGEGLGETEYYPERQGFDINIGGCAYGGPPTYFDPYRIHNLPDRRAGEYLPDRLADEAVAFLRERRGQPIMLFLWHYTVHWPMEAPRSLIDKYEKRVGPGLKDARYGAMIEALDGAVGTVLAALDELDLSRKTMVVFTSDNGGYTGVADNRPLRIGKGYLYEGGIRVPLIIRWPGVVSPGSVCREPVVSMDFYPTLLAAAGLSPGEGTPLDGEDLTPLLTQRGSLARRAICFHYPNYAWHGENRLGSAIREGDHKLIHHFDDGSVELYDLGEDIGESRDLSKVLPRRAAELLEKLERWRVETNAAIPKRVVEVLYVAPEGDDRGPGTIDRPLATLQAAKDRVRLIRAKTPGPVTVYLRAGTYFQHETIRFEPADSGSLEAPITYAAYRDELVVISGGAELRPEWTRVRDDLLRSSVPPHRFDQLFVDGKRQPLARWPDRRLDERGVDVGYATGLEAPEGPIRSLVYDPESFSGAAWSRPHEAILHVFQGSGWGNMQWRIQRRDIDSNTLFLGEGGWQIGTLWFGERANYVSPRSGFFVENVPEHLDAPGEWYHDIENHQLYLVPPADADVRHARLESAGRLRELFVFAGKSEAGIPLDPVHDVHLRGLVLRHTARVFLEPYETRLRGDWAISRTGAVRFDCAARCRVEDCHFDAVGGNGVFISNHAREIEVSGCRFSETGESAVCVVGNDDAVRSLGIHKVRYSTHEGLDTTPGPRSDNYPRDCRIADNMIHDIGVFGKQTAGVYISAAERITVAHNTIFRTPRAGICINDGCWGGHRIEFNDVFQTVRETGDHGPFNSWGRDRYWLSYHRENRPCDMSRSMELSRLDSRTPTIVANNRFVHESSQHSWGIDLDDGSTNYILRSNLCLGCSVKLREGYYRVVENNIFVAPFPPAKQCCFEGNNDMIRRNIVVDLTGDRGWVDFVELPMEMDHNLYHNFRGSPPVFRCRPRDSGAGLRGSMTFSDWRAVGLDRNSTFGDPAFRAPEQGDFSVREDSPALRLGFQNFPMDRFGTRKAAFQEIIGEVPRKVRLVGGELR